jgi:integrase
VWSAAKKIGWPFGSVLQLLILTGARRGEIADLRWAEVSGNACRLAGDRTKNGEPHTIPLSKPAAAIVAELPKVAVDANGNTSELVFTTNGKTPISGWSTAKRSLADDDLPSSWTIHDLRCTVATGLQRLGVGRQTIEAVLGHVSGSRAGVVGVYQRHSFDKEKAAALEAWGAHVMALTKGRKSGKVVAMRGKR